MTTTTTIVDQHLLEEKSYPVLPLRDVVVYPHMVIPLFVGREKSIKALKLAMKSDKQIFLVAQMDATLDSPEIKDLYTVGTIATILQLLELPDGTIKVLVEGNHRGNAKNFVSEVDSFFATVTLLESEMPPDKKADSEVLARSVLTQFDQYVKLDKKIPPEVLTSLMGLDDYNRLSDTIAAHMSLKVQDKQKILEKSNVFERLEFLLEILVTKMQVLQIDKKVQTNVRRQMEEAQRIYYLNEKLKATKDELDKIQTGPGTGSELEQLQAKIETVGMTDEAKEKALAELNKLKMMPPMSAESTVTRNYLDWLVGIPWKESTAISTDLIKAKKILDQDHYGIESVKERILELLAVQIRVKKLKGPILCLVGPPGTGKTSLGQSIANATGRKFIRMSLGGMRDEAEIRGHRRTYIGSMPGRIIQEMKKVKVKNPLFMLDEVDKIGEDFRGNPDAALLEVLDPEQNSTFNDHYLEVSYDLSNAMFILTANTLKISPPLLDRMEVIHLSGYTEDEKINIALRYLVPKQIKSNGLKSSEIKIMPNAIREIIHHYTREAGVRGLERDISKICRKVVRSILLKTKKEVKENKKGSKRCLTITHKNIHKYLGVKKYRYGLAEQRDQIGQVTGLAWTEVGGELLKIEASIMPGKGKSTYTGRLGDVMQESIQAAVTVVRSRSRILGIDEDFYQNKDLHIHVPEGATPKDGPSAGIGMCTALVSALTGIPVKADVAMTGEITLRGEVLPIGGLKEKLLAALRGGVKTVIIPLDNENDLREIPANITEELDLRPVRWVDQVLAIALQSMPEPLPEENVENEILVVSGSGLKQPPKKEDGDVATTH